MPVVHRDADPDAADDAGSPTERTRSRSSPPTPPAINRRWPRRRSRSRTARHRRRWGCPRPRHRLAARRSRPRGATRQDSLRRSRARSTRSVRRAARARAALPHRRRGRAGDRDGSGRWKLEHRRVADQRSRQREPRQRCAHQRRCPPSSSGGSGTGHSATATTPTIHVTETLRGRELVVHVSGPAGGHGSRGLHRPASGRTVASGAKTVALKHGRLTVIFMLGPSHGHARGDPRQREARSRAGGDEHAAAPASLAGQRNVDAIACPRVAPHALLHRLCR